MSQKLKEKKTGSFDLKFFAKLETFIGWEIIQNHSGILISQSRYVSSLLNKNVMNYCNFTHNPMAENADTSPERPNEGP